MKVYYQITLFLLVDLSTLSETLGEITAFVLTLASVIKGFFSIISTFSTFSLPFILENGFEGFKKGFVEEFVEALSTGLISLLVTDNKLVNGLFDIIEESSVSGSESGCVGDVLRVIIRCSILPASFHEKWVTVTGVVQRFTSKSMILEGGLSTGVMLTLSIVSWFSLLNGFPFKESVNLSPPYVCTYIKH